MDSRSRVGSKLDKAVSAQILSNKMPGSVDKGSYAAIDGAVRIIIRDSIE
jgi:hypothetical protein